MKVREERGPTAPFQETDKATEFSLSFGDIENATRMALTEEELGTFLELRYEVTMSATLAVRATVEVIRLISGRHGDEGKCI